MTLEAELEELYSEMEKGVSDGSAANALAASVKGAMDLK